VTLDDATRSALSYGDTWSAMVSHAAVTAAPIEAHRREQRKEYDARYRAKRAKRGKGRHGGHLKGAAWRAARGLS